MECVTLGQLVHSKAGRDKGKYFIIVEIISEEFVMLADGDIRKISNPKKKKIKHLVFHDKIAEEIAQCLKENKNVIDSQIRKCLQSIN